MLSLDNVFGPEQLAKRAAALERSSPHRSRPSGSTPLPQWQRPGLLCPLFVRGEVLSEADLAWGPVAPGGARARRLPMVDDDHLLGLHVPGTHSLTSLLGW
ncbi:hypothetical protein [Nonomuraea dietziae]|uniref:hypothetical protein n=1 Tax=Nonomuraea dietziae TaxID=65515 RepID=UPI0031DBE68B